MDKNITIFGKEIIDEQAIRQLERCVSENDIGVLTADAHYGYNHPIGGAVAYKDHISVSGVGFDIACGNKAVRTNIRAEEIDVAKIMNEIFRRISFGVGRFNNEPVDHPVLDVINRAEFKPQRKLLDLASRQLGTVGSGNHYVDLFEDEEGWLWIGVHFGSRGFGHKTTTGFLAMAQGKRFEDRVAEGSMDGPPVLISLDTSLAEDYIHALQMAGAYAYAGRDMVVEKVLEILSAKSNLDIHNHHNFAWKEKHFGESYWVIRKGCTPAFPEQKSFIGANMADDSFIVEGLDTELSRKSLFSTVHGAGRIMSRNAAAGKKKWIRGKPTIISKGNIDFDEVKEKMKTSNIELRGGGADEAPDCYKNLEEVLAFQGDTIKIMHRLRPIGIAMAGEETIDPYKD
ncbi:MAG: RtcB family protein [Bacteroidota bacterium]|nr:RtcB family protein [Bacteroidota bacterium]